MQGRKRPIAEEKKVKVKDEKRRAERLKGDNEVTVTIVSGEQNLPAGRVIGSHSKDISKTGAKIEGRTPLPVDSLVKLDFTLKDLRQRITAVGKVKWIKIVIEDESYEAGIEFVNTPDEALQKIDEYVSWKQKYVTLNPVGMPFWVFAKFNKAKPE